jgi:hypothetical protein
VFAPAATAIKTTANRKFFMLIISITPPAYLKRRCRSRV